MTLSRETQQKAVEDEKQDMQKTHTLIESAIAEQQRDNHSEETERESVGEGEIKRKREMLQKQMVILKVGYQKVDINISCEILGKYPIYSLEEASRVFTCS